MLFFLLSILWYLKAEMPSAITGITPALSHGALWERENPPPRSTLHSPRFYWLSFVRLLPMLSKGIGGRVAGADLGHYLVAAEAHKAGLFADRRLFLSIAAIADLGKYLVPKARCWRNHPGRRLYGTSLGRGRSGVVLSLQGAFAVEPDFHLSAVEYPNRPFWSGGCRCWRPWLLPRCFGCIEKPGADRCCLPGDFSACRSCR